MILCAVSSKCFTTFLYCGNTAISSACNSPLVGCSVFVQVLALLQILKLTDVYTCMHGMQVCHVILLSEWRMVIYEDAKLTNSLPPAVQAS